MGDTSKAFSAFGEFDGFDKLDAYLIFEAIGTWGAFNASYKFDLSELSFLYAFAIIINYLTILKSCHYSILLIKLLSCLDQRL